MCAVLVSHAQYSFTCAVLVHMRTYAQYSFHMRSTRVTCAPLPHINLITLGLPVVDAAGTQTTVTMNADAALAAFGEFAPEHAGPEFFSTAPRFTCTPSGRLLAVKIIRSPLAASVLTRSARITLPKGSCQKTKVGAIPNLGWRSGRGGRMPGADLWSREGGC